MLRDEVAKYREAAAECLELARMTRDEATRVGLLALAQKWLVLAQHHTDNDTVLVELEAFNNLQMRKLGKPN
jgi:hypothetical protein